MNYNESVRNGLFTEAFTQDPYETYANLRETDPVYRMLFPNGQYVG
ncbi:hypothetical protein J2Z23_004470 [Lederbergia galactosidilyticus]|nr:hypothetical protein [Lederbergia galactosidilytica]